MNLKRDFLDIGKKSYIEMLLSSTRGRPPPAVLPSTSFECKRDISSSGVSHKAQVNDIVTRKREAIGGCSAASSKQSLRDVINGLIKVLDEAIAKLEANNAQKKGEKQKTNDNNSQPSTNAVEENVTIPSLPKYHFYYDLFEFIKK